MIFKWWLQNGETCLHAAATSGNPKLVKLLLEHGADPALCNDGGQTALDLLMMFVNYGNITLTPNLLKVCLPKVEVTFYLRLRNEFQTFLAKNQANPAGQPIRDMIFGGKWLGLIFLSQIKGDYNFST